MDDQEFLDHKYVLSKAQFSAKHDVILMLFYLLVRFVLFVFSCGSKGFDGIVGPQGFPGPVGPEGIRVSRACSPLHVYL